MLLCLLGADIDTLLIAPRHMERTDFFASFLDMLLSEKGITNVRAVPDAFVPVIKIEYEGIEVTLGEVVAHNFSAPILPYLS